MLPAPRRVVITGLGLVTPLGCTVADNWEALVNGRTGIGPITKFDTAPLPVRFAGEVRDFVPERFIERKEIKKVDAFIQYAIAAAQMAVDDARLTAGDEEAERVGVLIGVGMGGLETLEQARDTLVNEGWKRISPFMVPRLVANLAPAHIAIRFGFRGENYAIASACASGGHSLGAAFRAIRSGSQDVVVAGGAEAAITPLGISGFAAMRALSTRNDDPARASRPFDRGRDGFVLGEGAGLLVLESLERAVGRGARIYAEIIGSGANADAYHITSPAPEGVGAARCIGLALMDARVDPDEVDYINAHGTSTPHNDVNETQAVKRVFGAHAARVAMSSTKSMTGHLLGAAGGVEAVYTVLALHHGILPPTVNYDDPDPDCDLDYVPNKARRANVRVALSNSFGFGGTNSTLVFRRWDG
jgi:3-oxoacyl-[acyl-carrier-protein] synthase II